MVSGELYRGRALVSLKPSFHQDLNGDGVIGVPTSPANSPSHLFATAGQDSFVFAPNFGQVTITNFAPETDTIQISQSIFANMAALLAATHDDAYGNAVITDAVRHDHYSTRHHGTIGGTPG
jgi:serralysin